MGKKVAIAQGFRLAFPDELGGMPYTKEEFEVYDIESTPIIPMKPSVAMPEALPENTQPCELSEEEKERALAKERAEMQGAKGAGIFSTAAQQKAIHTLATKIYGKDEKKLYVLLEKEYNVKSTKDLTIVQAGNLIEKLGKELDVAIKKGRKESLA